MTSRLQEKDAPTLPPATAVANNSQESNGAIEMMELLAKDLDAEFAADKVKEQNGCQEYAQIAKDIGVKK